MNQTIARRLSTSHAELLVEDTGGGGTPLLLIHGNSSCRGVFAPQTAARFGGKHRLITFDLPGHGGSEDAIDPARTYSRIGLAECAVELLERLGVNEAVVLGWSLGGHVAIEMLSRFRGMRGLILPGTPPIRRGGFKEGFVASPAAGLPARRHLSEAEVDVFARLMCGLPVPPFLRQAIGRADSRFREQLFAPSLAGGGVDQHHAVETSPIPIAVINGDEDPLSGSIMWRASLTALSGTAAAIAFPEPAMLPSGTNPADSTPWFDASSTMCGHEDEAFIS